MRSSASTTVVTCPQCGTPVESVSVTFGYTATYPGAFALPGGRFADGHVVGTGESPPIISGIVPRMSPNTDYDVVTVSPCGHELVGQDAQDVRASCARAKAETEERSSTCPVCAGTGTVAMADAPRDRVHAAVLATLAGLWPGVRAQSTGDARGLADDAQVIARAVRDAMGSHLRGDDTFNEAVDRATARLAENYEGEDIPVDWEAVASLVVETALTQAADRL